MNTTEYSYEEVREGCFAEDPVTKQLVPSGTVSLGWCVYAPSGDLEAVRQTKEEAADLCKQLNEREQKYAQEAA